MIRTLLAAVLVVFGAMLPATAVQNQAGGKSTREGVYSEEQADRGSKTFAARCGVCHKPDEFVGEFLHGWDGQTADALFDTIRTTMPETDPGSLSRQDYADVMAFFFKKNELPSGSADLSSASDDLKQIVIRR